MDFFTLNNHELLYLLAFMTTCLYNVIVNIFHIFWSVNSASELKRLFGHKIPFTSAFTAYCVNAIVRLQLVAI